MNDKNRAAIIGDCGAVSAGMVFTVLAVIIVAIALGTALGYYAPNFGIGHQIRQVFAPPFDGKGVVRILVLGEDNTGGGKTKPQGLSDTIILASINLDTKNVAAISIPRDTKVDLDGYGERKINAAHAFGGPVLAELAVEQLVGIRPDYYIKTNCDGFKESVDTLGGVVIDVEKDMHYNDNWGHLHINLHKGRQLLDGENAMGYVRFRHDKLGDITRMQRQQKFVKAFVTAMLSPRNLPKLPRIVDSLYKNVKTDLDTKDLLALAKLGHSIKMDQVKMVQMPATPQNIGGVSYMIADTEKIPGVVDELFFHQTNPSLPKVEVLNGSGISGAAQKVAAALKEQGYEVIDIGNADSFDYASSQVISHHENLEGVDKIAIIVNTDTVKQDEKSQPKSKSKADVTVIIGRNCILIGNGS